MEGQQLCGAAKIHALKDDGTAAVIRLSFRLSDPLYEGLFRRIDCSQGVSVIIGVRPHFEVMKVIVVSDLDDAVRRYRAGRRVHPLSSWLITSPKKKRAIYDPIGLCGPLGWIKLPKEEMSAVSTPAARSFRT